MSYKVELIDTWKWDDYYERYFWEPVYYKSAEDLTFEDLTQSKRIKDQENIREEERKIDL